MNKCLILANGRPPAKKVVNYLLKNDTLLVCADGGANKARLLRLVPDYIIGDLDSVTAQTLSYFSGKSSIRKITRQNDTDVEKCLKFAFSKGIDDIMLCGVTGDRLDHTLCNLGIVLKYYKKARIRITAENSLLTPYSGKVKLATIPGETISLYGFNEKTRISSKGLKYPLKNSSLPFGQKESTSNVALSDSLQLSVSGGVIFIIRDFNTLMKNDLI